MKIVIAGAGGVGFHLAELLAFENQDIVLIDLDQDVLDYAATHTDVLTIKGDCASIDILEQANTGNADLLLAVTTSEKTNLITAILAKKMGTKQTIARVSNEEYLDVDQKKIFKELGIDNIISPIQLAAKEISKLIKQAYFTDIFEFEDGEINLVGVTLDEHSDLVGIGIRDLSTFSSEVSLRPIAILRGHQTIIPRGETVFEQNDHVYFITKKDRINDLKKIIDRREIEMHNIMIIGGTELAQATALKLEKKYSVTLIEKDKNICKKIAENLHDTLVIHGNYSDFDLLLEEGLEKMDAFIALAENAETNIIACLTAENHGVYKTIALVENKEYVHVSQNIGVDTLINKKLIAANNIFRYIRKGKVEAIITLQGVDAEVIEYEIQKSNQLTRKLLKDLHFPKTALVGGVIRGGASYFPTGDFQIQVGDKVIVFALPNAIARLDKLFR